MGAICRALDEASKVTRRPSAIIAKTVKGKGVPFMEGKPGFHNARLDEEQFRAAIDALEAALASVGG